MAMLSQRGQDSTLYFGLSKNENGELQAHAWLRTGAVVVTGEKERTSCVVVGTFMKSVTETPEPRASWTAS